MPELIGQANVLIEGGPAPVAVAMGAITVNAVRHGIVSVELFDSDGGRVAVLHCSSDTATKLAEMILREAKP